MFMKLTFHGSHSFGIKTRRPLHDRHINDVLIHFVPLLNNDRDR